MLHSDPPYWTVKVCVQLKAEDRTGNMKDEIFKATYIPGTHIK